MPLVTQNGIQFSRADGTPSAVANANEASSRLLSNHDVVVCSALRELFFCTLLFCVVLDKI